MSANSNTQNQLFVLGLRCNNCARHVTEAIQSVPGVHSAAMRWTTETPPDVPAVIRAMQKAAYGTKAVEPAQPRHHHAESKFACWSSPCGSACSAPCR